MDDAEFWQAQNAGYRFINCLSRFNEYNGHWYVSVVMYRYPDTKDMQNFVFDTAWDEILW